MRHVPPSRALSYPAHAPRRCAVPDRLDGYDEARRVSERLAAPRPLSGVIRPARMPYHARRVRVELPRGAHVPCRGAPRWCRYPPESRDAPCTAFASGENCATVPVQARCGPSLRIRRHRRAHSRRFASSDPSTPIDPVESRPPLVARGERGRRPSDESTAVARYVDHRRPRRCVREAEAGSVFSVNAFIVTPLRFRSARDSTDE